MGITFTDVKWNSSLGNVLRCLWNLLIILSNIFTLCQLDPFEMSTARAHCNTLKNKPLFIFVLNFCTGFFFPVISSGIALTFLLRGRRIMGILDREPLQGFYQNNRSANFLFGSISAVYQIVFASLLYYKLYFSRTEMWKLILEVLTLYCINSYAFLIFFMLHYTQYGALGILKRIVKQLEKGKQRRIELASEELAQIRTQLDSISLINSQLCSTMASVLFVYIVPHVFNLVLAITVNIVCQQTLVLFLKWLFSFAYLYHLTTLNSAVLATYLHILELMKSQSLESQLNGPSTPHLQLPFHYEDLSLRVFNLTVINRRFLLKLLLLVTCNVVFFTQTA